MTRPVLLLALSLCACVPVASVDGSDTDTDMVLPSDIAPYVAGDEVDPFIGTANGRFANLNTYPGAVVPFGRVSVSPDTVGASDTSSDHAAGYLTGDPWLLGFSHLRLQGTSTPDLGAVLITAATADASSLVTPEGYRSAYADEQARPGLYAAHLLGPDVAAEVTASARGGHHRYTYLSDEGTPRVVVDLSHGLPGVVVLAQELSWDAQSGRLEGSVVHAGRFSLAAPGAHRTHVSITFDPAPSDVQLWSGGVLVPFDTVDGFNTGAVLDFDGAREVQVRVGLSFVDVEGARANREAELAGDWDDTRRAAAAAWERELASVRVRGGTDAQRRTFLTALYHSFVVPSTMTDVDGRYRGFDGEVHDSDVDVLSNFSLWDTYRTTHPLHALAVPERAAAMGRSLLLAGEQTGLLPRWTLSWASTPDTLGTSADIVLADFFARGIDGFDAGQALDLMLLAAREKRASGVGSPGREAVTDYRDLGYVPMDASIGNGSPRTVTRTLEYAIADGAIATLAAALGRREDAAEAEVGAQSYRALWDEGTHTFRGRYGDGSWVTPFDSGSSESSMFYGGSAWQYAWMVPHDMAGLVALHGTPEDFVQRLEAFLQVTEDAFAAASPGEPVASPGYWHGNEPDIHAPYLFLAAGRPDLTQRWVHAVSEAFYDDSRNGLPGNEDAGALSAWYVLSSLGLYPVPGTDLWLVGRPLFELAEVRTSRGLLTVRAPGAGEKVYVAGLALDGVPLDEPWLRHGQIADGAELVFEMSEVPTDWGKGAVWPER